MTDFVLQTAFTVPGDWPADAPAALYLPLGEAGDFSHPEALAYIDGAAYAGCDRHHQEILLPEACRDGRSHLLALHGWTGLGGWFRGELETRLYMRPCAVVQIDQPTRDLLATARVALGVAEQLDDHDPAKGRLYNALDDSFRVLDTRESLGASFYATVPAAHAALQAGIAKAGPPPDLDLIACGHAHLDVGWLWQVAQSRRKAGRTFHTVLRLTLLRSLTYPDPEADQGEHRFTYSLLPHPGDWRQETVKAAYALNDPLIVRRVDGAGKGALPSSLVSVDASNVIIETVKQAEDGNGLIARLYENQRCRTTTTLRTGLALASACRCNLLEEDQSTLEETGGAVSLALKPYQIVTVRLLP